MRIIDIDNPIPIKENSIVALGNFDGMHRGHQTLFRICQTIGKRQGSVPSVLLFKSHTREAIYKNKYLQLQSLQDKIGVVENLGIQQIFLLSFTEDVMKLSPEEFVDDVLIQRCHVAALVTGTNYSFGYKAMGNINSLQQLCDAKYVTLHVVPEVRHNGVMINSTWIRESVLQGEIEEARQLLGTYYKIRGIVGPGKRRGRHLGFPTANLQLTFPYCLPKDGVYFTLATIRNRKYASLTNIGNNPTFEGADRKIETHVLDFSGDLYDMEIQIEFVRFLRPDLRFGTVQELVKQIEHDIQLSRRLLAERQITQ